MGDRRKLALAARTPHQSARVVYFSSVKFNVNTTNVAWSVDKTDQHDSDEHKCHWHHPIRIRSVVVAHVTQSTAKSAVRRSLRRANGANGDVCVPVECHQ